MLIDGLQCGHFTRETFAELRKADVGAVTVTCGFWEGTVESLNSIARWRDLVAANKDLVAIATTVDEIEAIAASGRTAILLGFQNSNLLEGRIRFVELFAELGVRAIQLTYNNQNELGGSCYEAEDSGLSRTGKEIVREMNRTGILVDLSHVGNRTTKDAILCSEKPVAVTHANPDSLFPHKRNKTDDVLKALAEQRRRAGLRHLPQHHRRPLLQLARELVRDGGQVGRHRGHRPCRHRHRPQPQFHQAGLRLDAHGPLDARHRLRRGAPPPGRARRRRRPGSPRSIISACCPAACATWASRPPRSRRSPTATGCGSIATSSAPPAAAEEAKARVRADRSRARHHAARGRLVSEAAEERIALDVHAHLAPVLKDRLGAASRACIGASDAGALTIDGYTLAAKSVYRPEALLAWMDEHRVDRAWISIPPPLYRLGLDEAAMRAWTHYANDGLDGWRRSVRTGWRRSITCRSRIRPWRPRSWRRGRRAARPALPCRQDRRITRSSCRTRPTAHCGRH